ncbi:hypothetical protein F5887DRAFT_953802 [Amanita rubescens]|nr:hypothetical protein F5887DRAFT_953802 [Amanita rubescens]
MFWLRSLTIIHRRTELSQIFLRIPTKFLWLTLFGTFRNSRSLLSRTMATASREHAQLTEFSKTVWGKPGALLKSSGDIEYIDLEGHEVFRALFAGELNGGKILVRDEYRAALEELEKDTYRRGAYVTGQPGIGKTYFLAYLLINLLWKKHTVALQLPDGRDFYALFKDSTVAFHSLANKDALLDSTGSDIWALSNSNAHTPSLKGIFLGVSHVRVIQATLPREWWKQRGKEAHGECYIMDVWSRKEIEKLAKLRGLDSERMSFLAQQWGCDPRSLIEFMELDDSQIEEKYKRRSAEAVQACGSMLSSIEMNANFDNALSLFYICRPLKREGVFDRTLPSASVPTKKLRSILGVALQNLDKSVRFSFFRAPSQSDEMRQAAGFIFESWFHSYMAAGNSLRCHWAQGKLKGQTLKQLAGIKNLVYATWDPLKNEKQKLPFYWVAPKKYPGINSALICDDGIYVFQVTISSKHKPPTAGMEDLQKHLSKKLRNKPWRVVFVGDTEAAIQAVTSQWMGKLFSPTDPKESIPIAWCALDPVRQDITYREWRELWAEGEDSEYMAESSESSMEVD